MWIAGEYLNASPGEQGASRLLMGCYQEERSASLALRQHAQPQLLLVLQRLAQVGQWLFKTQAALRG